MLALCLLPIALSLTQSLHWMFPLQLILHLSLQHFIPRDYTWYNLRIAHLNCRSLLAHNEDVLTLASDGCIDVFALSETWLDETVLDGELCFQDGGFSIVRNDRNHRGGGVAFLVANHIRYIVRSDLCSGKIESLWLQLFPGSKRSMLVCCAYRPPSCMEFFEHLSEECELSLVGKVQKLCINGDFNSDFLQPVLHQTRLLLQLMKHFNFHELVGKPTRVIASGCSQIDVILTNVFDDFRESVPSLVHAQIIISVLVIIMPGELNLLMHLKL